jgi:hypothetical protein
MAKRAGLTFDLEVRFVPIKEDEIGTWRAGLSLLLQIMKGDDLPVLRAQEVKDGPMDADHPGEDGGTWVALLPVEEAVEV